MANIFGEKEMAEELKKALEVCFWHFLEAGLMIVLKHVSLLGNILTCTLEFQEYKAPYNNHIKDLHQSVSCNRFAFC